MRSDQNTSKKPVRCIYVFINLFEYSIRIAYLLLVDIFEYAYYNVSVVVIHTKDRSPYTQNKNCNTE